ncbi:hypothetical protein L596_005649 [Steinernema carpocapsae]|uniref:Uncharacterized protein n=1 Tax=Steinernema carpocapsae TaxID=34508 RepID=A0A4U8UZY5_STECR|nr:hypothetical protein L596_005649 [Steinernema carpocapsae]
MYKRQAESSKSSERPKRKTSNSLSCMLSSSSTSQSKTPLDASRTSSYAFFEHVRTVFETPEETAITLRLLQLSGDRLSMKTKEQLTSITVNGIRNQKDIETCGEIAMALEQAILATQQRIAERNQKAFEKQQKIVEKQQKIVEEQQKIVEEQAMEDDYFDMPKLERIDAE